MRLTAVAVLAVIASACSTSDKPPAVRTVLVERAIPPESLKACASPVRLPDRDLPDAEAARLWGSDRTALRVCESRRAAAVEGADVHQ